MDVQGIAMDHVDLYVVVVVLVHVREVVLVHAKMDAALIAQLVALDILGSL